MADLTSNPSIGRLLAEIDRRLRALETAPQLGVSSIRKGGLNVYQDGGPIAVRLGEATGEVGMSGAEFYDENGVARLWIGRVQGTDLITMHAANSDDFITLFVGRTELGGNAPPNTPAVGIEMLSSGFFGRLLAVTSEEGFDAPQVPIPARKAGDAVGPISSGAFTASWRAQADMLRTRYASVEVVVQTTGTATAEARVNHGNGNTSVRSIGAGSSGTTCIWRWDFGEAWDTHAFTIEVRVTGGSGNIFVYEPIVQLGRGFGSYTLTGI